MQGGSRPNCFCKGSARLRSDSQVPVSAALAGASRSSTGGYLHSWPSAPPTWSCSPPLCESDGRPPRNRHARGAPQRPARSRLLPHLLSASRPIRRTRPRPLPTQRSPILHQRIPIRAAQTQRHRAELAIDHVRPLAQLQTARLATTRPLHHRQVVAARRTSRTARSLLRLRLRRLRPPLTLPLSVTHVPAPPLLPSAPRA
jgi:hypothetical protein